MLWTSQTQQHPSSEAKLEVDKVSVVTNQCIPETPADMLLWLACGIVRLPSIASFRAFMFTMLWTKAAGSNHWFIVTTLNHEKQPEAPTHRHHSDQVRKASAFGYAGPKISITCAEKTLKRSVQYLFVNRQHGILVMWFIKMATWGQEMFTKSITMPN